MKTNDELRAAIFRAIHKVAPEAHPESVSGSADIRDELDIDSMDFLSFATALHQELGIDIPERDYPKLRTIDGAIDYLARALQ